MNQGHQTPTLRTVVLAAAMLPFLAAAAEANEPLKVGEYEDVFLQSPHPYPLSVPGRPVVWEEVISWPGATYISVHFAHFDLAPGDYVEISNPNNGLSYRFTGKGTHDAGTFWATHVKGDMVTIKLHGTNPEPGFGFVIDRYAHGFISWGPAPPIVAGQDSLCGADDRQNAICYQAGGPHGSTYVNEYNKGRAVARLLIQGSGLCTGSLVSCNNHFFTNEHCINSQTQATNTDYEFMAEAPTCGTANCQLCHPGTIITGATFIQASAAIDYSLVRFTPQDPQGTYGFIQIDNREGVIGERIFLPQHSNGDAKEFGIFSDSTASGFCEVVSTTTNTQPVCTQAPFLDLSYWCDSEGGSSGSPLMSRTAGSGYLKLIGLNHCSIGCGASGSSSAAKITNIMADLPVGTLPGCTTGYSYITLNRTGYVCQDSLTVNVFDITAISAATVAANVTLSSTLPAGESETIAAGGWTGTNCAGANCNYWQATIPVSNAAGTPNNGTLNVQDGATITAFFNDPHPLPHADQNDTAPVECAIAVCKVVMDPLTGGCDGDTYHDEGEVLNYWVGIGNVEGFDLPGPFTARLRLRTPDAGVTIVNDIATFPALGSLTYAYGDFPYTVRYTGNRVTFCNDTLEFEIYDIQSVTAGAFTGDAAECTTAGYPNDDIDITSNWDDGQTMFSENFDSGSPFPGTMTISANGASNCLWLEEPALGRGNFSGGTGNCASADNDICGMGTTMDTNLRSPAMNLSTFSVANLEFKHNAQDYYNSTSTLVQARNGIAAFATIASYPSCTSGGTGTCCLMDIGTKTVNMNAYTGGANTAVQVQFRYDSNAWNCFWQVDDIRVLAGTPACENSVCVSAPDLQYADLFAFDDASCNDDGFLDPGETGDIILYVDNVGNDWAYGTTATLSCPACPVNWGTICKSTATYGNVPFGTAYVFGAVADAFNIALNPALACNTTLPFQITLNATNPYGPVVRAANVVVGSPQVFRTYEEHVLVEPEATSASGRVGFTAPWTTNSNTNVNRVVATPQSTCPNDADTFVATIISTAGTKRNMAHVFSMAGVNDNVTMTWDWDLGPLPANSNALLDYTPNGGTNWFNLVTNPGLGTGAGTGWQCWGGSLYATILALYGQASADAILNNPNFGIRFNTVGGSAGNHRVDNMELLGYSILCTATACTGACAASGPPPIPDGNLVPGTPVTATKNGANVNITYDPWACATDHQVLWGNISSLSWVGGVTNGTISSQNCSIGTSGTANNLTTPAVAAGQCFFFVVDTVMGTEFGAHGANSSSNERNFAPSDAAACGRTKDIGAMSCFAPIAAPIASVPATRPRPGEDLRGEVLGLRDGGGRRDVGHVSATDGVKSLKRKGATPPACRPKAR